MTAPGAYRVRSFVAPAGVKGELDLRDPRQAAALANVLEKIDPAEVHKPAATDLQAVKAAKPHRSR